VEGGSNVVKPDLRGAAAAALFTAAVVAGGCQPLGPGDRAAQVEVRVMGTVLDAGGSPVPGAQVRFAGLGLDCERLPADGEYLPSHPAPATTDSAGRYAAIVLVEGDSRGRPQDCLRVDVRVPGGSGPGGSILLPDGASHGPVRIRTAATEVNVRMAERPALAAPAVAVSLRAFGTDSVEVTAELRNAQDHAIRFFYQAPCPMHVRAYAGSAAVGDPTWHDQLWVACKAMPYEWILHPGEALTFRQRVTAQQVLRDAGPFSARPLPPPGDFTFEAVVPMRQPDERRTLVAGTARLQ
jgi:hypothetical protein